eukprot:CAMPEP_0184309260 /NCGR_PEP_ID=MMETSP1049-20130417/17478_1 /TAXON_ID=77928 /ORGANISM="Proteomonas sulcata, Strain CCMP704" /LENGTH=148 /DNA_ID=CAMNT_0026622117 /DNA_START=146 /DNA_END=589 /DNA_ORIENTATION=+
MLQFLYLNDNKLEGNLPEGIRDMKHLKHLGLWTNRLTGNLPEVDPAKWPELEYLWLNANNFTGSIHPSLSRLPKLKVAYFAKNWNLGGNLPPGFSELDSLQLLFVQQTNISGHLPCAFLDRPNMMRIDATITNIEGCQDMGCLKEKCE